MKNVLREWYSPTHDELGEFYKQGTIALDANVLLSLYRVNGSQRAQILSVLGKIGDRLWIPFQVAYEYQKNRLKTAWDVNADLDEVERMPETAMRSIAEFVQQTLEERSLVAKRKVRDREMREAIQRHFREAQEELIALSEKYREKLESEFGSLRSTHALEFSEVQVDDPVRAALDALVSESNTGAPLSVEESEKKRAIAQRRMEEGIPPGYKDYKKKPDPLGDCLIWFELLEHAKCTQKKMLFVTDDVKEDFYVQLHGRTIGPRIEMVMEMATECGQSYHQTTLEGFLRSANTYLDAKVEEETISTVRSARESRESRPVDFGPIDRVEGSTTPSEEADLSSVEYDLLLTLVQKIEADTDGYTADSPVLGMLGPITAAAESRGDIETLERVLCIHSSAGSNPTAILNTQLAVAKVLRNSTRPLEAINYLEGAYASARRAQSLRKFEIGRILAATLVEAGRREAGRRVLAELLDGEAQSPASRSIAAKEMERTYDTYLEIFGKEFRSGLDGEDRQ
ncbi:PIN domain-containing protein [Nocardia sp. NPDC052316]|uniref:PIN domain-containing protein n=1 Tax=Nocardia sp. NPDC052316 TaxID=3364329 RepID=UPI0037C6EAD7